MSIREKMVDAACRALIDLDPTMFGYHEIHIESKRAAVDAVLNAFDSLCTEQEEPGADPAIMAVAKAIARDGFGRSWHDFAPIDVHETDQSDLIEYAEAAFPAVIAALKFDDQ